MFHQKHRFFLVRGFGMNCYTSVPLLVVIINQLNAWKNIDLAVYIPRFGMRYFFHHCYTVLNQHITVTYSLCILCPQMYFSHIFSLVLITGILITKYSYISLPQILFAEIQRR